MRTQGLTKCWQSYRKALVPASDCIPPYGGANLLCIADPVKGVEAKTIAKIGKGCVIDSPECHLGGDCVSYAPSRVVTPGRSSTPSV